MLETNYNLYFSRKYIRQALLNFWNIINKNVRLKMIFPKRPMIAYSQFENVRDSPCSGQMPYQGGGYLPIYLYLYRVSQRTLAPRTNLAHVFISCAYTKWKLVPAAKKSSSHLLLGLPCLFVPGTVSMRMRKLGMAHVVHSTKMSKPGQRDRDSLRNFSIPSLSASLC